ncbi:MAG: mannosyltransferase family protein [Cyanobacteria bacterium J06642_2]
MKLFGVLKPLWPTDRFLRRVIIASVLYQIGLSLAIIFCACSLYSDLTWIQLKNLLSAWDGGHYLYLARYGYQTSGDEATFIAFYPLYPWLIRLTSQILPNEHLAAVSVTILGSIVGHVAFAYYLLKTGCNRSQIWRILCLLFLTPISVYFSMIYTEGMFLAETALCLLALRCDRYAWAAGFGLMASATRLVGILSIVPFISRFIETQRWRSHWQSILWVCLIPLGYGIYLYLNWKFFGDPFHYRGVLGAHWQKTAS